MDFRFSEEQQALAQTARALALTADGLTAKFLTQNFDQDTVKSMVRALSASRL